MAKVLHMAHGCYVNRTDTTAYLCWANGFEIAAWMPIGSRESLFVDHYRFDKLTNDYGYPYRVIAKPAPFLTGCSDHEDIDYQDQDDE